MGQNEHSGCSNWGGYKRLKSLQAFPCVHFDDILQYQIFGPNSYERGHFSHKKHWVRSVLGRISSGFTFRSGHIDLTRVRNAPEAERTWSGPLAPMLVDFIEAVARHAVGQLQCQVKFFGAWHAHFTGIHCGNAMSMVIFAAYHHRIIVLHFKFDVQPNLMSQLLMKFINRHSNNKCPTCFWNIPFQMNIGCVSELSPK